jgi:hypothetical protein
MSGNVANTLKRQNVSQGVALSLLKILLRLFKQGIKATGFDMLLNLLTPILSLKCLKPCG